MTVEVLQRQFPLRAVGGQTAAYAVLYVAFLATIALLPFELPVAEGVHGVFRPLLGAYHPVLFVGSLLLCASVLLLIGRPPDTRPMADVLLYSLFGLLYVAIGVLALLVTAMLGADMNLATRQLLFGYLAPVGACLAIATLDEQRQHRAWLAFYLGWVLFLAGSLPFLALSYRQAVAEMPGFAEGTIGQQLIMWRYTFVEPWNTYAQYIGNANKTSNNLVIFLLLSGVLLDLGRLRQNGFARFVFFCFWALGLMTLFLLFSRAALVLLPLAIYFSGVLRVLGSGVKWLISLSLIPLVALGYSYYADAVVYLASGEYLGAESAGVLGTMWERFNQWSELWDFLERRPAAMFFGLGTGGFGEAFFGDAAAGTHNTFFDVLLESGLTGLFVLILLVILMAFVGAVSPAREHARVALVGLLFLVLFMIREHSFSYLYVTSLGGFCLVTLFYLLSVRDPRSDRPTAMRYRREIAPRYAS